MFDACRSTCWMLTAILGASISLADSPSRPVEGQTEAPVDLTFSLPSDPRHTLWIPDDYKQRREKVDVLINFHGSPRVAHEGTRRAGLNCVVISINYGGLSSVYRRPFAADRELFATILSEALAEIRGQPGFPADAAWGRLAISSFSAGFGAVREVLKSPDYFAQIDGLLMLDSLYCGYVGDGTGSVQTGVVHPGLMKDFVRFAEASARGKKVMIVTHCNGPTPGYASTRETADYLLEKLKLSPSPLDLTIPAPKGTTAEQGGLQLDRQAARQGFSLYGSPGGNETDHVQHLRQMGHWLRDLPLAKRDKAPKALRNKEL